MNRTVSLALTFLFVASMMLVFVAAMPTVKAAGRTLYFVGPNGSLCETDTPSRDWFNPNCWSLSSGGAVGEPIPTANDDAVFDAVSANHGPTVTDMDAVAHDLIIDGTGLGGNYLSIQLSTPNFSDSARATLTVHSLIATFPGDSSSFYLYRFGDQGQSHFKYTGTISSNVAAPDCDGAYIVGGMCIDGSGSGDRQMFVEYIGTNVAGTASRTSFADSVAVTKTVYCDPDCTDIGGNTNIIFGPCPGTDCTPPSPPATGGGPAPTPTPSVGLNFRESVAVIGLVLLVAGAGVMYLGVVMQTQTLRRAGLVVLVIGVVVLFLAVFYLA